MSENKSKSSNESGGPVRELENAIHTDFSEKMSYADYLQLDSLLTAQKPRGKSHDEMLFIILHQASELWIKLMVHEVRAAISAIERESLQEAFKMLSRVSRIQAQIIQSWDVLSTMTPSDYLSFRDDLGQSSGFQSWQYRALEFLLGNRNRALLDTHKHDEESYTLLTSIIEAPSIYDQSILLLHRKGFDISDACVERDWSVPYEADDSVQNAWLEIYRNPKKYWELYELAEKLVDVEDWFQQWRFRHVQTVERIIGFKSGTGGSSGVPFIRRALEIRFFPELWALRTLL
jgi:tryptophan 2,3-dioxygenase